MSTKIFYTICANKKWQLECIDINSAFLQGAELQRDVFLIPPKEAKMEGKIWKMRKAAYGLCDASRKFWQRVMDLLLGLGGRPIVGDETLLYFHNEGNLIGLVCLHVDDILAGGSPTFKSSVIDKFEKAFKISETDTFLLIISSKMT